LALTPAVGGGQAHAPGLVAIAFQFPANHHVGFRQCAEDERQVLVRLTPEGRTLKSKAACIPVRLAEAGGFSPSEIQGLRQKLKKLRSALSAG